MNNIHCFNSSWALKFRRTYRKTISFNITPSLAKAKQLPLTFSSASGTNLYKALFSLQIHEIISQYPILMFTYNDVAVFNILGKRVLNYL